MKKQIAILLIASTLASVLSLASCKQKSTTPENPFDAGAVTSAGDSQSNTDPDTGFDANQTHGEKILYGKKNFSNPQDYVIGDKMTMMLRFGDMLIRETSYSNMLGYFSFDEPDQAKLLCMDPLCLHWPSQQSCTAAINYYYYEDRDPDPIGMYIDLYERSDSPVIYLYYRRDDSYTINTGYVTADQDPFYCIERFDLSQGKRYSVFESEYTITHSCNYGDYVYFVLDESDGEKQMQKLGRVHKSGGKQEDFDLTELPETIKIIDVVDDKFYYITDEQYLYRSNLDLTGSEMVLDLSTVRGQNESIGVVQGSYSGYLYYIADAVTVYADNDPELDPETKVNLYRIPMNDLAKEPEMVVEGMVGSLDSYMFAEKTLYYMPCVQKIDASEGGQTAINISDGKLMALDLQTGESKTIVENSGMTIFPKFAWDDCVIFTGWAYNSTGEKYSDDNNNMLIAYASGEPFKIWCRKSKVGSLNDEYLEELQAAWKAALDAYEAQQNGN